jgi:hypothetical protein
VDEKVTEPGFGAATPIPAERAFVIQVREPCDGRGDLFIGRVEHLTTGDARRFRSIDELIAFVTHVLARQSRTTKGNDR